ncbi:MAG: TM0106 family RecB-like putative nuclease [Gaiellaceae bacterium]
MRLAHDGTLRLSPSDLGNHLACPHLTQLEVAVQRGELVRPHRENPHADLIRRKGDEHEAAFLARLREEGRDIVEIELGEDGLEEAALATEEALHEGGEIVYQGVLASNNWRGIADFLIRVDEPSVLGPFSYEAWDTKLARHAKPNAVLQLTFYSHELERIQGRLPERMHVVLGTGAIETFRPADFAAFFRRASSRLAEAVATPAGTYPYPVDHCSLCDFLELCKKRWCDDDHLSQVAWIRHDQIERLNVAGIATLEALGETPAGTAVAQMAPQTFESLRHQAALQLEARRTGTDRYDLLPPQQKRGLGLLPVPDPGDLFYDIEGDPFWEPGRSLEYLHGMTATAGSFTALWAHDRESEKRVLEELIDGFHVRLAAHPGMHVYHYASYETAALKRLAAQHATREEELDELLRREVFCDLFTVVRQALRISYDSYSIKKVRELFMRAEAELEGGEDAILLYEQWLAERDPALLEQIERYNEEDCLSNLRLRDWLVERRQEAEGRFAQAIPWREAPEPRRPDEETRALLGERAELRERLVASGDPALELAGELLEYHRREAKPVWWWYFRRCEETPEELVEDSESIGSLEPDGSAPEEDKKSLVHGFRFPVQQHRLDPGDEVHDPLTQAGAGEIVALDSVAGTLRLRRGPKLQEVALPQAIIPGGPWNTKAQREALARFARSLLAGDRRYPHLERILRREPPLGGARVQCEGLEAMGRLVREVEGSHLFVQGPPGSGKTWTGARLITYLVACGKRVAIASQSHKAIHNLLSEIEADAVAEGVSFRGLKKSTGGNEESVYEGPLVTSEPEAEAFFDSDHELVAGTSWLYCRQELDSVFDYLFVDEAGQTSLADALAMGTAARTLVLLGDPIQLAQVTQGIHPAGSGVSVLQHLLQERATVPEDMGLFLERSFRMHPDVCRYISSAFYEDRLESAPGCAAQGSSFGTGLRFVPVEHVGNSTASEEEAAAISAEIERLLGGTWTDAKGVTRPIEAGDVMVVAPFNAQVKTLTDRLQAGVAVGTVDKFQGQQAPVVFFSMAASSGEDAPRGIDFLMSRNRLNVAVSRAQCLAYLVCAPRLLDVDCKTVEHMRLANALCRFVELAEGRARGSTREAR